MMNNTQTSEELRKQTAEKRKQIDKLLQLAQKDYQDGPDKCNTRREICRSSASQDPLAIP